MARGRRGRRLQGQRQLALVLLPAAAFVAWRSLGGGGAFVATSCKDTSLRTPTRIRSRASGEKTFDQAIDEVLFPPEQMWKISDDGMTLREIYPGARDFNTVFWAIVQPAAAFGFLVVGLSAFFNDNIVDWNPVTAYLFPFLKKTDAIQWMPQGIFMTFYGFFGLFLFGPLQWWLISENPGTGVAEFNKNTEQFTMIRDNEVIDEVPFENIKEVKLVWGDTVLADRDIFIIKNDGEELHFMNKFEEYPKRVLERRASILSEFLGKELDMDDA